MYLVTYYPKGHSQSRMDIVKAIAVPRRAFGEDLYGELGEILGVPSSSVIAATWHDTRKHAEEIKRTVEGVLGEPTKG